MDSSFSEFEWSIYAGFASAAVREEFLIIFKSCLRDCWFNEILNNPIERLSPDINRAALMGDLQIFVSEAKNIGISEYKEFISKSLQRKNITQTLNVLLNIMPTGPLAGKYKSLIIEDKDIAALEKTLSKTKATMQIKASENLSWANRELPGGEKEFTIEIAEIPKTNILLKIKISLQYKDGESVEEYVFGEAE